MDIGNIIPHIEALIFASDKPLTALELTTLINNAFGFMEDKITLDQIETCIEGIREKYSSEFYPFEIRESGGGLQFLTKKDYHKTVGQLNGDKFLKRLSAAALETLAIIAYKQPITKGEIESIRGVSTDYSIQKLLEKELVLISGRSETLPGKPLLYQTSKTFMDYFGLNNADDLPKIKEVLADQLIMPSAIVNGETVAEEEEEVLVDTLTETDEDLALEVSEDGELIENHIAANEEEGEIASVSTEMSHDDVDEIGDESPLLGSDMNDDEERMDDTSNDEENNDEEDADAEDKKVD